MMGVGLGWDFQKRKFLMAYISIFGEHFLKNYQKKRNLVAYVSRSHDPPKNENGEQVGMLI